MSLSANVVVSGCSGRWDWFGGCGGFAAREERLEGEKGLLVGCDVEESAENGLGLLLFVVVAAGPPKS